MIRVSIDSKEFAKDMRNIMDYSYGFIDGINKGKSVFFRNLGINIKEILGDYIDSNARVNPSALHHVYEWYQIGDKNSRLFEVNYTISNLGLSFITSFRQSKTVKDGSRVPFYNKAEIMENGTPVTIRPVNSDVLVFEGDDGEVFTKSPVRVEDPGGAAVQGSFERVINSFFTKYFTQAFMRSSGMSDYLENPVVYRKNLSSGKKVGRSKGIETGYRWIANAGLVING
jgi:hypothetical protein